MYYIKGYHEVLNSIRKAIGLNDSTCDLLEDKMRLAYYDFLKKVSVIESHAFTHDITLMDFDGLRAISPLYCNQKKHHFDYNSPLLTYRLNNRYFHHALCKINELNSEIYQLANFIIKIIVLNQLNSHTNGTTEDSIGLSFMNFKDHFDIQDFIELVFHQLIHMLLFVDHHSTPHMITGTRDLMIETGLPYVLGGTKFPAYLAFHSYIVAVEVLFFRVQVTSLSHKTHYHGDTHRIVKVCDSFQTCMIKHFDLFSTRGQSFLNDSFIMLDTVYSKVLQHG